MEEYLIQSIESCRENATCCKACAAAMQGDDHHQKCISRCLDCAAICELCVSLGEKRSEFYKGALQLAIEACILCAETCEETKNESCIKCAWQCRKCIVDISNITS